MKDDKDCRIPGNFKYPLPVGMDVQNLPPQLKQRRETVLEQVGFAMDQAADLGEELIQALGPFLLESGFSVEIENQIAITPEIIVVLLGIAAGHVAATDQSAELLIHNPGFARSVEAAYRQNLRQMFQVGYEATSQKIKDLEQASPKLEERVANGKGGKLLQFPGTRATVKKSDA